MNEELWANLYCQKQAEINGRHVWLYLVACSIGNIALLQHEDIGLAIHTKLYYDGDYDKIERDFVKTCKLILDGKL